MLPTIQRHDNMKKIAKIYQTIHGSHIRLKNEFNIFQEIEKYDSLIQKADATMYDGWENIHVRSDGSRRLSEISWE